MKLKDTGRMINPFRIVRESDHAPHARTLRTGFLQKLKDAFRVIHGDIYQDTPEKFHVGLFDYATLFIPLAIQLSIPYFGRLVEIPRFIVSAFFTAITAPVTLGVHVVSTLIAGNQKNEVFELPVELNESESTQEGSSSTAKTLRTFLKENKLDDLEALEVNLDNQSDSNRLKLQGKDNLEITPAYINISEAEPSKLKSFFNLNVGGVVRNLEASGENEEMISQFIA